MNTTDDMGEVFTNLVAVSRTYYRAMPSLTGSHTALIPLDQLIEARNPIFDINLSQRNWIAARDKPTYIRYLMRDYLRWKNGADHFVSFLQEPTTTKARDRARVISTHFTEDVLTPFSGIFEYLLENYSVSNELAYALTGDSILKRAVVGNPSEMKSLVRMRHRALLGDLDDLSQISRELAEKDYWLAGCEELETAVLFESAWHETRLVANDLIT